MTPLLTGVFASQISGHLETWQPTSAYDALATVTVPSGGLSNVVFAGIPQTGYSHLQLRILARGNYADPTDDIEVIFNNDSTAVYSIHSLSGDGSTAYSGGDANQTRNRVVRAAGATAAANIMGAGVVDILDYTNVNKNKVVRSLDGVDLNGSGYLDLRSMLWKNKDSIQSITLNSRYGTAISQHSSFVLYGVK